MAYGRNRGGGLDLSGVGKNSRKVSGGRAKNRSGVKMAPHSTMSPSSHNSNVMSKSNFSGAMVGRPQRRVSARTVGTVLAVVVAAVALAVLVGYLVYQQTAKNAVKADLDSNALAAVLAGTNSPDDPYWSVVVSTDAQSYEDGRGTVRHIALMYADPGNKSLSLLWIPGQTRVYVDGYGYHEISEVLDITGEAGVCAAVGKLGNVEVAHYMEVNRSGLARLEEMLGITAQEAPENDPRATCVALAKKLFGASTEQLNTRAGYVVSCVATDMDEPTFEAECLELQGMDTDEEIYSEQMPSKEEQADGNTYLVCDVSEWTTMVARVSAGMSPTATESELGSNEQIRSANVVDIWNGVGVSGVARDCSEELQKHGWTIENTGNAAQFVYEETLVVYKDNDDESAAKLLVADLGQGRVVRSAFRYSYTGDILVVVGKDYQPH